MHHFIIAKFREEYTKTDKQKMYPDIVRIFDGAKGMRGIHGILYHYNCTDRANRYDIMIDIDMDADALPLWDACAPHKEWKSVYGDKLLSKCIFDCED